MNIETNTKLEHLRHKIGQMLFVGFHDSKVDEDSDIVKNIQKHNLGGVIYFDYYSYEKSYNRNIRSPKQLATLTKTLQEFAPTPLFIGADIEGGKVNRLKKSYGFDSEIPSYFALGERDNLQHTYLAALKLAILMKSVGINFNFSPVMDLSFRRCPIIGDLERSFSNNPETVYRHCREVIKAHNENGIISVGKHFPGHGSARSDTHMGFVDVTDTWVEYELKPFEHAINNKKLDALLVAHTFNKRLDEDYPATLSYKTQTELLREKMGFKGVIISDDIDMFALRNNYSFEEILTRFINAGGDVLLIGNGHDKDLSRIEKAIDIIVQKVEDGIIPVCRINESYQRIMQMKEKYIFSADIEPLNPEDDE
jgi:beta-N-acetylhexosaminidase